MRHFKSIHFPSSDTHAQPFFAFNHLPTDVVLAVLEHCSPFDLVQLGLASRAFRAVIAAYGLLWVQSQLNLSLGTCPRVPPLPAIEANGNFSQSAYASWLFGGGSCTWCSKWTESQPTHFIFRFRACSATCKALLLSASNLYVDRTQKYDDFSWGKWLPRIERELSNGEIIKIYSARATKDAERERQQAVRVDAGNSHRDPKGFPCRTSTQLDEECTRRERSRPELLKNAFELEAWHKLYMQQHAVIWRSNYDFLKRLSTTENVKIQGVMRCPTIISLFAAFNRDLELITHTVWSHNKPLVFAELKFLKEGVFPAGMTPRRNDSVRCSSCSRLIKVVGMGEHLKKHGSQVPDVIPLLDEGKENCLECPNSTRLFTVRGLKDHRLNN
ncbi:hypothetical protein FB451DRAFT_1399651 [Mycena latifolia]|nr:hypothetical protein FB451DRAFT_1399651 [Mycena latifolia]